MPKVPNGTHRAYISRGVQLLIGPELIGYFGEAGTMLLRKNPHTHMHAKNHNKLCNHIRRVRGGGGVIVSPVRYKRSRSVIGRAWPEHARTHERLKYGALSRAHTRARELVRVIRAHKQYIQCVRSTAPRAGRSVHR